MLAQGMGLMRTELSTRGLGRFAGLGLRDPALMGVAATLAGVAATTLVQVVGLPLMLHAFGVELYGQWLLLVSLPMALTILDVGFTLAGSVKGTGAFER